jgi:integrase/recombinase XerD
MKATKIVHHSQIRIRVDFDYDAVIAVSIKTIADARWSRTLRVWHIPYTHEAFVLLKTLFPDVEIGGNAHKPSAVQARQNREPAITTSHPEAENVLQKPPVPQIAIRITPRRLFITLPQNDADYHYLISFRFAHWDANNRQWIIPNYRNNLALLTSYFAGRNLHTETITPLSVETPSLPQYQAGQLLVINQHNQTLRIYFCYNQSIIQQIKQLPLCR